MPRSIPTGRKNSAAFWLPRDHAWPTYLPLSQSIPGNLVLNSKKGSQANEIQKILQVWKPLGYRTFRPCYEMGNGPQLMMLPFFSTEVIPDFPAGSFCPPWPIFTLSAKKALWMQSIIKRHDSFLAMRTVLVYKGVPKNVTLKTELECKIYRQM